MNRTMGMKINGLDSALRVLTTLRRKQFQIDGFSMKEVGENIAEMFVTIYDDKGGIMFQKALLQMEKIAEVTEIAEVM
ncbi:MAG: hypothetical protein KHZ62_01505 [Clostridiales bacterium]|nr:hypothetical protein [Clostridiales bacterium]